MKASQILTRRGKITFERRSGTLYYEDECIIIPPITEQILPFTTKEVTIFLKRPTENYNSLTLADRRASSICDYKRKGEWVSFCEKGIKRLFGSVPKHIYYHLS